QDEDGTVLVFRALSRACAMTRSTPVAARDGLNVRVAISIVNNRPETMERIRPHVEVGSSHDAAVRRGAEVSGGPGSAMHHSASARGASHPGPKPRTRSEPYSLFKQPRSSRSRGAFLRPGFATLLRSPESRGGRSAEKRSGAAAPVGHAITRHARRLAR